MIRARIARWVLAGLRWALASPESCEPAHITLLQPRAVLLDQGTIRSDDRPLLILQAQVILSQAEIYRACQVGQRLGFEVLVLQSDVRLAMIVESPKR